MNGGMDYVRILRDLREDADKTQTQIAEVLGTSQTMYARYERGANELPIHHLITLSKYYGVSTDYLLGRTDNPSPPELYTPQEIELIRQYRSLDERGRRSVEGALRFEQEWSYRHQK